MDVPAFAENFDPIKFAVPFFVILIFAEMWFANRYGRVRLEPRDSAASLMMGLGNTISSILYGGIIYAWFMFVYQFRLLDIPFAWWAWILALVLDDFVYYWSHRWAHTVRWFWAEHVIHHSSQHYNLTTALRQPWTGLFTLKWVWLGSAMIVIGFHPVMVVFVGGVNLVYQFWIHTEVIRKCPPWFEAVMNTPSHHRVHHGINPQYLDRNYAGIFIVWDRLFGTFQPELEDEEIRYGIVKNLGTYNPLRIAFHEWLGIADDMRKAGSFRDAMMYLLAPPGWSPDGSRDTSRQILDRYRARTGEAETPPEPAE